MNISTIIKVMKVVAFAVTVVPPVIDGGIAIGKATTQIVKNRLDKSKYVNEIKKDFKLRRDGIVTVKFEEV